MLTEYIQEEKEEHLVIGGDYNARTGNRGGPIREDKEKEKEGEARNSRDKVINREGRVLINKIEERGWTILNGLNYYVKKTREILKIYLREILEKQFSLNIYFGQS